MRQLASWRFIAAVVALAALALLARALFLQNDSLAEVVEPAAIERRIDLIAPIAASMTSDGFAMLADGTTTGVLDLQLDDSRLLHIVPGTFGEIDCDALGQPDKCAVLADMLGDAVIWFAILPTAPRATVELPPIIDLDQGRATFENGWAIPYAPVITRECGNEDIPTFSDFLRRFGPDSTTILDLATGKITAVRCGEPVAG